MRSMVSRLFVLFFLGLNLGACITATPMPEPTSLPRPEQAAESKAPASSTAASPSPANPPVVAQVPDVHPPVVTPPVVTGPVVTAPGPSKVRSSRPWKLECVAGSKVKGLVDRWSPLSTCPEGYEVTGLGRIDLQGDHNRPNLHVNDFICDDRGCKAWCIGDGCTVEARCCRIMGQDQP